MAQFLNQGNIRFRNLKDFLLENPCRINDYAQAMAQRTARRFQYLTSPTRNQNLARKIVEDEREERYRIRQGRAPAVWHALKAKAEELKTRYLPQSTLGNAVRYFTNEYEALTGYLRDGRFEIDNNLVENAIRPTAVGRRRWLFIGHPDAGWRSAVLYSIIGSCRRRAINPQEYLTNILCHLPTAKIPDLHGLLPANWKALETNTS
jgi:hypothetical protein